MSKMLIDRAAFERHAERLGYSVDPDTREGREGGYWSSHTQLMWLTWQAALAEPVQEFATTNIGCLGMPVNTPVTPPQTAEPVQDAVAQISANRVIAAIEEWKSLWWKVPPFASKVNRATREAITVSHNPLFALLLDAQAAKQMPKGCTTPSGCQQHGCHGECLPAPPQHPAQPPQDHFPDATKMVQEPVTVAWDGRCMLGHCNSPAGCENSGECRAIERAHKIGGEG